LEDAMAQLNLSNSFLLNDLKLPMEQIMNIITSPEEVLDLSKILISDSFFHHSRWFRNIIGDAAYEKIALDKMKGIKNPIKFLSIKEHLEETGALTSLLIRALDEKISTLMSKFMKKYKLERLALIVDVSRSMNAAIKITTKLYKAFSKVGNITDLIAFNDVALSLTLDRLKHLHPNGSTSIGSAIFLLMEQIRSRNNEYPQAIIIVSDLGENTKPSLKHSLNLFKPPNTPPLIILHCGHRSKLSIDYPHAIIKIDDFHESLIMNIMEEFARLISKVALKEKNITEIIKTRMLIKEEIGSLKLHERLEKSYKKGYLERILCPN
jgi:hypothetical protein